MSERAATGGVKRRLAPQESKRSEVEDVAEDAVALEDKKKDVKNKNPADNAEERDDSKRDPGLVDIIFPWPKVPATATSPTFAPETPTPKPEPKPQPPAPPTPPPPPPPPPVSPPIDNTPPPVPMPTPMKEPPAPKPPKGETPTTPAATPAPSPNPDAPVANTPVAGGGVTTKIASEGAGDTHADTGDATGIALSMVVAAPAGRTGTVMGAAAPEQSAEGGTKNKGGAAAAKTTTNGGKKTGKTTASGGVMPGSTNGDTDGAGAKKGLPSGAVAGIVVGFLLALVALFFIVYYIMRKRRRRDSDRNSISTNYVFEGFEGSGGKDTASLGGGGDKMRGTQHSALDFSDGPLPAHELPGNWKHVPAEKSPFDDPPEMLNDAERLSGYGGLAGVGADPSRVVAPHAFNYERTESDDDHTIPVLQLGGDSGHGHGHLSTLDNDTWLPYDDEVGVALADLIASSLADSTPAAPVPPPPPSSWAEAARASITRAGFVVNPSARSSLSTISGQSSEATAGMTDADGLSIRSSFDTTPPNRRHFSTRSSGMHTIASVSTYPMPTAHTDFSAVYDAYCDEPKKPVFSGIFGRDKGDSDPLPDLPDTPVAGHFAPVVL